MAPELDEQTLQAIVAGVAERLREQLEAVIEELVRADRPERPLTVGEVAERFGVARSTVYAHWREWGGYKLGEGEKAPIRFDGRTLDVACKGEKRSQPPRRDREWRRQKRSRRDLLSDNPPGGDALEVGR